MTSKGLMLRLLLQGPHRRLCDPSESKVFRQHMHGLAVSVGLAFEAVMFSFLIVSLVALLSEFDARR